MNALRELRRAADLSQEEFARLLGIAFNTFRMWDNGLRAVPVHAITRAQAALADRTHRNELLSLDQLADEFGMHQRTLRAAARSGVNQTYHGAWTAPTTSFRT